MEESEKKEILEKIKELLITGKEENILLARTLYKSQKITKPYNRPLFGWTDIIANIFPKIIGEDWTFLIREYNYSEKNDHVYFDRHLKKHIIDVLKHGTKDEILDAKRLCLETSRGLKLLNNILTEFKKH